MAPIRFDSPVINGCGEIAIALPAPARRIAANIAKLPDLLKPECTGAATGRGRAGSRLDMGVTFLL